LSTPKVNLQEFYCSEQIINYPQSGWFNLCEAGATLG